MDDHRERTASVSETSAHGHRLDDGSAPLAEYQRLRTSGMSHELIVRLLAEQVVEALLHGRALHGLRGGRT